MSGAVISLILDSIIIVLLAVTVFYALRLSSHIKLFRDSRKDLGILIKNLSLNIDRAERSIEGLRQVSSEAGRDLQALLNESRTISDELQLMIEAGDSLAQRLEGRAMQKSGAHKKNDMNSLQVNELAPLKSEREGRGDTKGVALQEANAPGFSIRDFDFETSHPDQETALFSGDDNFSSSEELQSRAERELYDALRSRSDHKTSAGDV